MLESMFSLAFLLQTLRISVPYALPALGAMFSERGGVVNIALEGMMIIGAFAATVGTYYTGSPTVGILCGIIAGAVLGFIHAVVSVTFKANQIVSGIALNLFALGFTKFACRIIFNSSSNSARIAGLETWTFLPDIPILGQPFIVATVFLCALSVVLLYRTRFGLRLRAVGEHPEAADSLGIHVEKTRYYGVIISGVLSGLAGTWLALDQHSFTDGMSAGRGYIALAAMIVGKWRPIGAVSAALLFGFAESASIQIQGETKYIQFIQMIPYVLTMIVLAGFIGRAIPPAAAGTPFTKGKR